MFLAFSESTVREIKSRIEAVKGNAIVAVYDEHTRTFYCAHIAGGVVVYCETCGPLSREQADETAAALNVPPSGIRSLDKELTH